MGGRGEAAKMARADPVVQVTTPWGTGSERERGPSTESSGRHHREPALRLGRGLLSPGAPTTALGGQAHMRCTSQEGRQERAILCLEPHSKQRPCVWPASRASPSLPRDLWDSGAQVH